VNQTLQVALLLLLVAAAVGLLAKRLRIHYNIALVLAGLALGATGSFPRIALDPAVVLQVFLPILLFEAAIATDMGRLRESLLPVATLAGPGMLVAIALAGGVLHVGLGFGWVVALLLGAILSATDTIAVIASFRKVHAPARLTTLVETESLFNDGTALVAFSTLLGVALSGRFDLVHGLRELAWVTFGGLLLGWVAGYAASLLMRRTHDHLMEIMLSVVATYGSSVLAESLHASPVLAVVAAGITVLSVGWPAITPTGKVAIRSVWEVAAFGVNSVVFLLIGLQVQFRALWDAAPAIGWGLLALTLGRAASIYVPLGLLRPLGVRVPLRWQHLMVWGNLKGSLSMALALSLPAALAQRDQLLAIVFGCAIVTLTVQGLSLAPLARAFGVGRREQAALNLSRRQGELLAARAGQAELDRMQRLGLLPAGVFQRLRAGYQGVIVRSERDLRDLLILNADEELRHDRVVRRRLLAVERAALREALDAGMLAEDGASELLERIDRSVAALNEDDKE
jgi:CPA1 family monovalent cation:H+ antiporter